MPRTKKEFDKLQWIEQYEHGKSEKQIARDARCDVRTVKRAIQEHRYREEAKLAHVELVKDALRRHQEKLLADLDQVISMIQLPDIETPAAAWYEWEKSELALKRSVSDIKRKNQPIAANSLLRDHLKNDRLWKVLARFKRASDDYEDAKIAFQIKTANLLEEKTGLKLLTTSDLQKSFLYDYNAGDLVYKTVIKHAFGKGENASLEAELVAGEGRGEVKYRNQILANAPGLAIKVHAGILETIKELEASPEVAKVVETYNALKEASEKASFTAQEIKSLGMIPGLCDICRRLGLR